MDKLLSPRSLHCRSFKFSSVFLLIKAIGFNFHPPIAMADQEGPVRRTRNSPPPTNEIPEHQQNNGSTESSGITYWVCVILGISSLLPWNLFITAHGYFTYKFRNESKSENATDTNDLAKSFEVYFTLTGSVAAVFGAILNGACTHCISSNRRMIGGHLMVLFMLIVSFAFCFVATERWRFGFLALNLVLIVIGQIGCTFIAGSTFSIAAQLPDARFTNAVMSAQAFCGIFTSTINIISIAVGSGQQPLVVGSVYFGSALVFVVFSLGMYFRLLKNRYAQYHMRERVTSINDDVEPLIDDRAVNETDDESLLDATDHIKTTVVSSNWAIWKLIKKTWYHGTILMLTLMATMTCFPSVTSLVHTNSDPNSAWQIYFIPVCCFLMFNTMDFIGRLIGHCLSWPKPGSPLFGIATLMRFGFVFLFLFCNLPPYSGYRIFSDDAYFVLFIGLFGLTNGYLCNLAAIYLPSNVDEREREKAGASTAFFGTIGVLMGSLVSLFIVNYVNQIK